MPRLPQVLSAPLTLLARRPGPLLVHAAHQSDFKTLHTPVLPSGAGKPQPQDAAVLTSVLRPSWQAGAITSVSQVRKLRLRKTENLPGWSSLGVLAELCSHHHLGFLMGTSTLPISEGFIRKLLSPKKLTWSLDSKIKSVLWKTVH